MGRVFSTGFELNSTTTNMEFDSISGLTIQTGTIRSGAYAGQTNISASTSVLRQVLFTSNQSTSGWFRAYIYISALPNANVQIMRFETTANASCGAIRLNTSGTLNLLQAAGGTVGSASAALSTGQWYRLEINNDASGAGALDARIDGVSFASGANSSAGAWARIAMGGFGTSATYNFFWDDVAVNDSSGSFQNTWPGAGSIIHLRPSAAGDSNTFTVQVGGTAGAGNNFTRVNEITPDDATSYNGSAILTEEDLFNVDNTSLSFIDTVNVVAVGVRMADLVGADATAAFKVELMKTTGGTKAQSANIIPNSTTWKTNAAATPWTYPLITYQDPDAANWTQSTLDTMQIGYTLTATNVQTIAVSNVWALVDYTPATFSESEAIVVSEQVDITRDNARDINKSETITISESTTALVETFITKSEAISVAESITLLVESYVGESESLAATDSPLLTLISDVNESESISLAESLSVDVPATIDISQSISLAESISLLIPDLYTDTAENIAISESTILVIESYISESEGVIVAETLTQLIISDINKSETIPVAESLGMLLESYVNKSDSIIISENSLVDVQFAINTAENISTSESLTVFIPFFTINVVDSIAVLDTPTVGDTQINTSQSIGVSESVNVQLANYALSVSDSISVSESVQFLVESHIGESEILAVAENSQVDLALFVNEAESIGVSESLALLTEVLIGESESVGVNDSPTTQIEFSVVTSQAVAVAEAVTAFLPHFAINVSESITVNEAISFSLIALTFSDSIGVSESVVVLIVLLTSDSLSDLGDKDSNVVPLNATTDSITALH